MATKYTSQNNGSASDSFRLGLLANANRGGENVATGALLGAVFGATVGFDGIPTELLEGLATSQRASIDVEVEQFLRASSFASVAEGGGEKKSDL